MRARAVIAARAAALQPGYDEPDGGGERMARVRLRGAYSRYGEYYAAGEVAELPGEVASRLVAQRYAEWHR